MSKKFNNKACHLVPTTPQYIHVYMVTGTMWTFVYKEVAICACAAVKLTGISLKFTCFLMIFNDVLSGIWCEFADVVCLLLEGGGGDA